MFISVMGAADPFACLKSMMNTVPPKPAWLKPDEDSIGFHVKSAVKILILSLNPFPQNSV